MADFYVDLPALEQLSSNLASIHNSLTSASDDFTDAEACLGSAQVAGKLHSFSSGWRDGRKTIEQELVNLMNAIKGCYDAYEKGEQSIVQNAHEGGVRPGTKANPVSTTSHGR